MKQVEIVLKVDGINCTVWLSLLRLVFLHSKDFA
jgi:hypothetical protein